MQFSLTTYVIQQLRNASARDAWGNFRRAGTGPAQRMPNQEAKARFIRSAPMAL
jgi:hypothetical protein